MIGLKETKYTPYRQCEIRRPSNRGYYFDIRWVEASIATHGSKIVDQDGDTWTVHEVHGLKHLPGVRGSYRREVV